MSNIAWAREDRFKAYELLNKLGVKYLEAAPTLLTDHGWDFKKFDVEAILKEMSDHGLKLRAFQSVTYGLTANLFAVPTSQDGPFGEGLHAHLLGVAELAEKLDVRVMVFGSPRNRRRFTLRHDRAWNIARLFFKRVSASLKRVIIALEANPIEYGCDFILNTSEASRMCRVVGNPKFKLNLDTGCHVMSGGDPVDMVTSFSHGAGHVHISEPHLAPLSSAWHPWVARALTGRAHAISMEMRPAEHWQALEDSIKLLQDVYLS